MPTAVLKEITNSSAHASCMKALVYHTSGLERGSHTWEEEPHSSIKEFKDFIMRIIEGRAGREAQPIADRQ